MSLRLAVLLLMEATLQHAQSKNFNRIASFPICSQIDSNCNDDTETVAEIVTASEDGMTLVYGDSANNAVGFVDISDPGHPKGLGFLDVGGEVTSVGVTKNNHALVAISTSGDVHSGVLKVVDIVSKTVTHSMDLGGQPDAVAVSPDKNFAAIAIENERDEDLGDGAPPQMPAGFLVIVDTSEANPTEWTKKDVSLTGLNMEFPTDPEPEFVAINSDNVAVVTLQENNGIVLVDVASATVTNSFSAGTVDLHQVDTQEEGMINQNSMLSKVPREPDGVTWLDNEYFATADEGDLNGGSRGFTIFAASSASVTYTSGSYMDHAAARLGHYPDERSGNKGNEPENVAYGEFGTDKILFVNSERSSLVFVYDVMDPAHPKHIQTLPAGLAPEGALAIPQRDLLVVASEKDDRGDKMRSVLNIYHYAEGPAQYPTIISESRYDGTPISWSALSGLAAGLDKVGRNTLYAVEDSFYKKSRIFKIDTKKYPAHLTREIRIVDGHDKLASLAPYGDFSAEDLAALLNADKTVNIDPEGIAVTSEGFWVVSEGRGTVGDADRPVESLNFLFMIDFDGIIERVVTLPDYVNDIQLRFGFEGVTVEGQYVVVAFQRAWGTDANPRLGIFDTKSMSWKFVFYPLDAPTSQNGGWVGLSDITSLGGGKFLVLERDNQGGPDASIKKIYSIDLGDLGEVSADATISKTLFRDLMPDLKMPGGLVYEKIEGMAVTYDGIVWIVNDNDGVDDNSGETQLLNLGQLTAPLGSSMKCHDVKEAYQKNNCCGNPAADFEW